ncbi:uncharacterized protein LOC135150464 [Daucus carota subsp. sativus]|uniref:uncharacterized protein LOC135150464 n=1 Tax=Daucus carota subsp. sativus TaxID=79200 RepID=UPI003083704A
MSTQKLGIKVPPFDKNDYNNWKMKMLLYVRAANPLYIGILENGPFVPMKIIPESVKNGVRILQKSVPKEKSEYTETDKEYIAHDHNLQLIIMWDAIEALMEGSEEVRENIYDMLIARYEAFKAIPGGNFSQIYERFMLLLNELTLHGKTYTQKEINRKLSIVMPPHLVVKTETIRERSDFRTMTLERLFGKPKTFEMELEQREIIYGSGSSEAKGMALQKTAALIADEPYFGYQQLVEYGINDHTVAQSACSSVKTDYPTTKSEIVEVEIDEVSVDPEDEFYTREELEQLEDKSMAYMAARFKHIKFSRNPRYKKASGNKFQNKEGYSGSGSRSTGNYKTNLYDKSKVSPEISVDDMTTADYKKTINELGQEMYNLHTSLLALESDKCSLSLKIAKLEERIDELALEKLMNTNLKERIERIRKSKEILDSQRVDKKVAIGLDYSSLESSKKKKRKENEGVFVSAGTENAPEGTNIPKILKNTKTPIFRKAQTEHLIEEDLVIKEELKNEEVVKPQVKQETQDVPSNPQVREDSDKKPD